MATTNHLEPPERLAFKAKAMPLSYKDELALRGFRRVTGFLNARLNYLRSELDRCERDHGIDSAITSCVRGEYLELHGVVHDLNRVERTS